MPSRKVIRSHPMTRISCPSCAAVITVDSSSRSKRIQCPRCLNHIEPGAIPPPPDAPVSAPAKASSEAQVPSIPHAHDSLDQERELAINLQTSVEILAAENLALRAIVSERDALAAKLRAAESAIADTAALLLRFQDMEQRIYDIGIAYIRAVEKLQQLEREHQSESKTRNTRNC